MLFSTTEESIYVAAKASRIERCFVLNKYFLNKWKPKEDMDFTCQNSILQ